MNNVSNFNGLVSILILNWNNPAETIDCIDSLVGAHCLDNVNLVLVDNNSSDNSIELFTQYFDKINMPFLLVDNGLDCKQHKSHLGFSNVFIIKNEKNSGYAGGNNVGIKFLIDNCQSEYIWILNNDVLVNESSLQELINVISCDDRIGFVSSVLVYKNIKPYILQCYGGGVIYPLLGVTKLIGKHVNLKNISSITQNPDYLMGASLLVRTSMIKNSGLMDESYFMYYEETDWQKNAQKLNWKIAVSEKSLVFHGDSQSTKNQRWKYHYYRNRAAIMFTKKHYGRLPAYLAALNLSFITLFKNYTSAKNIFYGIKGVIDGLFWDGRSLMAEI